MQRSGMRDLMALRVIHGRLNSASLTRKPSHAGAMPEVRGHQPHPAHPPGRRAGLPGLAVS
ncbi:MAG: hypothetical protein U5Q44_04085, partial [Dehalococcoidia bacterium]|nr:hypothetical protein [Dehalococcoidia bacterium]